MPAPGFASATSSLNFRLSFSWRRGLAPSWNPKGCAAGIGLVGGLLLLTMGVQLLASLPTAEAGSPASVQRHPLWIGVALTGANPYFLLWWATVGLTLTSQAMEFGILALVLFAALRWMCDLGWLEAISFASFKGCGVWEPRSESHFRNLRRHVAWLWAEVRL